jgi:cellulose synthase/poly-beta-1,6-N-acetylglucosamine synthase-like glycosyltransferase
MDFWETLMIDILRHNIISLIPVYRENEDELRQTISAFQQMRAGLNIQLVFIVDGYKESLPSLHKLLGLSESPDYQIHSTFNMVSAVVPECMNTNLNFDLLVKHAHGGKRDSIALFLRIIFDCVTDNLAVLRNRYPDAVTMDDLLKRHELSLFIIDSDTHFAPDALHQLYHTLWHDTHADVYCATPALQCRAKGYKDFFSLAQNAEYQIMNQFILSYLVNGENIASDKLLFGLQACGMLKAAHLMDQNVIQAFGKKSTTFKEAIFWDMNEDTFLSTLIQDKNPKLMYVSSAHATTVLPSRLGDFLIQKKRWRNGNLLHQKTLKQKKIRTLPFFKKITKWTIGFMRTIFYSPAAYFYLLLSILSTAWNSFQFGIAVNNYLFAGFLLSTTVIMMWFNVRSNQKLFDAITILATFCGITTYASILSILIDIAKGNGTLAGSLAVLAIGVTPLMTMVLMLRKSKERMSLFVGLIAKYLMLEPIFRLIFPIYSLAKLDDLSWNVSSISPEEKLTFTHDGARMKYELLSIFIIKNLCFGLLISFMPITAILACFAAWEILQWLVLILAPLLQVPVSQRPIAI